MRRSIETLVFVDSVDDLDLVASSGVIFETGSKCFALLVGLGGRLRRL